MASREAEVALSVKRKRKGHAGKKRVHEMHIRRAKTGGFIVRHDMEDATGNPQASEEHAVPDSEALHDHVEDAFGEGQPQEPEQAPEPEGAEPGNGAEPQGATDAEG